MKREALNAKAMIYVLLIILMAAVTIGCGESNGNPSVTRKAGLLFGCLSTVCGGGDSDRSI